MERVDGPKSPPLRQVRKRFWVPLVVLAGLVPAAGAWSALVEPAWIEVTGHRVEGRGLRTPLRIAHVTDLHSEGLGRVERRLVRRLGEQRVDVVVITGDTTTPGGTLEGYLEVWRAIVDAAGDAPVVAVRGNWEYWEPADERLERDAGVRLLQNRSMQLRDDVWIVGVDDSLAGTPDRVAAGAGVPDGVFRLGLLHSPQAAHGFALDTDLMLAGHTHGGQLVWPLLGPPLLPPGSGDYVSGWYEERGVPLFVSRGIGTSVLPIRFNCRPELAVIEVTPAGAGPAGSLGRP